MKTLSSWLTRGPRRPRLRRYIARPAAKSLADVLAQCNRAIYDCYSTDFTVGLGLGKFAMNPLFDYERLLRLLASIPGVRFLTMDALMRSVSDDTVRVCIRHDVDADVIAARALAELERAKGIPATYYLLHTSWYYGNFVGGVFERNECMGPYYREIQDLGHEIGLHTDGLHVYQQFKLDGAAAVEQELAWLRSQGLRIVGTAAHNHHTVYGAQNFEIFKGRVRNFVMPGGNDVPIVDEDEVFFKGRWAPLHRLDEGALSLAYEGHDAYKVPGYLGIMAEIGYSTINQTWNCRTDWKSRGLTNGPGDFAKLEQAMRTLRPGDAVVFTTHPDYYGGRHANDQGPALRLDAATRRHSERFGCTTYVPGSLVAVATEEAGRQTGQAIGFANEEGFLAKPIAAPAPGGVNVVIFGGRQLEGAHLGIPDQVQGRMEAGLAKALGRAVQVRSFASADLDAARYATVYGKMDPRLRPAIVLAAEVSHALVDAVAAGGGQVFHLVESHAAARTIPGVPVIDPAEAFARHAGPGIPVDAQGRWTATGHRLAAELATSLVSERAARAPAADLGART